MHPTAERLNQEVRQYFGKYGAEVLDNGPPKQGEHRGEILVKVPGILEEDPADRTGLAQRPLQVLAKPCLPPGFFFVPEKGDRVWVEFAAGDIDVALWSGVWYPADKTPKTSDGKAPTESQNVVRTAKEHVVLLDNTDGKERVVVVDGANKNQVTFDKDGVVLEDGNGNKVILGSDGIQLADKNQNTLTMSSSGIVLENAGGRKMEIASAGITVSDATGSASQPVALAPLLDWLMAHQHVGNMGAPTPLFPADLAKLGAQRVQLLSGA
jgi:hypothetical protein